MTGVLSRAHNPEDDTSPATDTREGLWWPIALHLAPGALLGAFIVAVTPLLERRDIDPLFALFGGIALVPVPFELGYLAWRAHRETGSWSPLDAVGMRERLPRKTTITMAAKLAAWFIALLVVWVAAVERWVADNLFGWMPEALRQFAEMEGDAPSNAQLAALLLVAIVFNGFVGPVPEELYFRGHLLPRLGRLGSAAPLVSTLLFALYHVWTPWRWPMIAAGFLPTTRQVWRHRSIWIGIATHVTINLVFLVMLSAALLSS